MGPARRARVLRLLRHRDRRAARRRPAPEPQEDRARLRAGARAAVPDRHRARDDVAQEARAGPGARGRHEALLLPHPPVRGAPPGADGRGRVRPGARARHELRRPRGRPRPARAELPLRPPRADGRQHHDLPPGLRRGRPQARAAADLHAEAVHRRLGQRPPPPLHALRRRRQQRLPRPERPGAAVGHRALLPRRPARALPRADVHRQPDGQLLLPHVGHGLLGADLQELGLAEPHDDRARRVRRPLRVPRRRLLLQPVPHDRRAAGRRPRRHPQQDRPGRAAAGQHLRPAPAGRRDREGAGLARRRARGARRRRARQAARCPAASTRSSTTTSATSGSATSPRSPTGSARSTWRCCRRCAASPGSSAATASVRSGRR